MNENERYFTTLEFPLGLGEFLHQAIGNHGISEFSNRVLQGGLAPKDERNIKLPGIRELLHMMCTPNQLLEHPNHWVIETIDYLLEPDLE